nr:unnamed protein product [Digitaria exilis]
MFTETLFNPYALSCGHLFCKACACGAASVYIFQGVKSAPLDAKCPGQRLLEAETARRANHYGEAVQRILGLTGHAIIGDLKSIFLRIQLF